MKSLVIATAFAFATMTSVGLAEERAPAPQKLTEAQMGQVTAGLHGGALITVETGDVASGNQITVAVPVNAAVAVAAFGSAAGARADQAATVISRFSPAE